MQECHFILLGATGDLALRKIFPALYRASLSGLKPTITACARSPLNTQEFIRHLSIKAKEYVKDLDPTAWESFTTYVSYTPLDLTKTKDFQALKATHPNTIIYFSIAPEFFAKACQNLAAVGLNAPGVKIVLEKPLGTNLASCQEICRQISQHFKEEQIYRIDHYLGKQSVQNLFYLRANNPFLAGLLGASYLDHVQISVLETLGVESRGGFYDPMGALRDMLQNHMLQMLALATMPANTPIEDMRQAKLEMLKSLKPLNEESLKTQVVRGQYSASQNFKGYKQEEQVSPNSQTETFVALKLELDHPNWQGVPFYLRTGKRMGASLVQVVFVFKGPTQTLVYTLQPQCSLKLQLQGMEALKSALDAGMDAYERLILEVVAGNQALFNHQNELEAAWSFIDPILESWQKGLTPLLSYPAGGFGPEAAFALLSKDNRAWITHV
ncbi:glucose-6-phosphate dehydrogenase [Helicobacter ailurogastricus]|uniref:glucose-6-phosphate dehydrogenase n=1 Tax=Helicobacter ailurogastricus TaxID=1578720 RepID=UPI0022C86D73|nr:glucose-6-phosphate dehydrogenase [Helicobacter ailurogastricus]GLH58565.1 Glucose-6-phosphate 1-dehydrogenase [Helicobacter ailurogastricus]GLH60139.1 Glucose-6-phosphate 1-dehydrogenase [Helicobacter ailurogastricus]